MARRRNAASGAQARAICAETSGAGHKRHTPRGPEAGGRGHAHRCTETPDGEWLDGSKNDKLNVPANVPVKDFWAVTVYDLESASYLRNQDKSSVDSSQAHLPANPDGTIDLYFGPEPPPSGEKGRTKTASR